MMKKYKIKYQFGNDIFIKEMEGESEAEVKVLFYIENRGADILEIKEVIN